MCVANEGQRLVKFVREQARATRLEFRVALPMKGDVWSSLFASRLERHGLNDGYQDPSIWCDRVRLIEWIAMPSQNRNGLINCDLDSFSVN